MKKSKQSRKNNTKLKSKPAKITERKINKNLTVYRN